MASPGINNGLVGSIATGLTYNNEFPQPGVDQPSQQFRDNYKVLQVGIENLQTKTIEVVIDTGSGTATSGLVQIGSGLDPVTLTIPLSTTFLSTSGGTLTGNLTMAAGTQINSPANQNLVLTATGSGRLVLDGVNWPNTDGTVGQVLTTNGSGNLSWSSRLISVQSDTSPGLGGALDTNGFGIIGDPFLDLVSNSQRVRVSGSGPGPADGVLSAGDAPLASNNPGGVLTLIGGTGNGVGAGGDVILGNAPGGSPSAARGSVRIGYKDPLSPAPFAIWPSTEGTNGQVLTTNGAGVLSWTTVSGGGGGGGTITQITSTTTPIIVTAPTGPVASLTFNIDGLPEDLSPLPSDWVIIQKASGGAFRKAQTQNLPGGGGGGSGSAILNRAFVFRTSSQSITNGAPTIIAWPTLNTQTPGTWWNSGANTRLTVPAGITKIRLYAGLTFSAASTGTIIVFLKRTQLVPTPTTVGNIIATLDPRQAGSEKGIYLASPILDVNPGDYFEIEVLQTTGSTIQVIPIAAGPDGLADPGQYSTFFAAEEVFLGVQNLPDLADVNISNPGSGEDRYALVWDNATSKYILSEITGNNVGTGASIFKTRNGNELDFRTVIESGNVINITENTNDITFSIPGIHFTSPSITPATGTGTNSFAIGSGASTSTFDNAVAIGNGVVTANNDSVRIGTSSTNYLELSATGDLSFGSTGASLQIDNLNLNGNTLSSTDVNGNIILSPNGSGTVDVATSRITNVVNPTSAQDAATKAYVDNLSEIRYVSINSTGTDAVATGTDAIAIGEGTTATATNAVAIGPNVSNTFADSAMLGYTSTNYIQYDNASLTLFDGTGVTSKTITVDGSASNIDLVLSPKGSGVINVDISRITNVTDPINAQDAATKNYVDSLTLDGLSDVVITSPLTGSLFFYDGVTWQNNNRLLYLSTVSGTTNSHELRILHPVDPSINAVIKTRTDTTGIPGRCQIQSTVNNDTHEAQLQIIRDDSFGSTNNIALNIKTITSSRLIALQVQDPNASFSTIKQIVIDADNNGINMDGMLITNAKFVTQADTTVNRPVSPIIGQTYFDTTIGRPIWFDGVNWINASGAVV